MLADQRLWTQRGQQTGKPPSPGHFLLRQSHRPWHPRRFDSERKERGEAQGTLRWFAALHVDSGDLQTCTAVRRARGS